jgi:hypothetical protein
MKISTDFTIAELQEMYLDWVNNFLTVKVFAEYYEISVTTAADIIEEGETIYELYIALSRLKGGTI